MCSPGRPSTFASLLLVLFALHAGAQDGRSRSFFVTGTVRAKGGMPLVGASILIAKMGIGDLTRDGGRYRFSLPDARVHGQTEMLAVRLIGYRTDSVIVRMDGDSVAHDFELTSLDLVLGPVVITGPTSTRHPVDAVESPDEMGSHAQGLTLSGRITDAKSGAHVEAATVSVGGLDSTTTDVDGRYLLSLRAEQLHGRTASLIVRLLGYTPASRLIELSPGATKNDFALARKPIVLGPVKPAPAIDWIRSLAGVSRSSGWPDLESGPHEKGVREIRIWPYAGMVTPQTAYRLTRHGNKTMGDIVRYQQRGDSATLRSLHAFVDSTCSTISVDSVYVCHLRQRPNIEWSKSWDSLQAMHVWSIPDEADTELTEPVMNDGGDVTVELWDGKRYRVWGYNTYRMFGDDRLQEKREAGEILKLLGSIR